MLTELSIDQGVNNQTE